jgi:hypothetical protein
MYPTKYLERLAKTVLLLIRWVCMHWIKGNFQSQSCLF